MKSIIEEGRAAKTTTTKVYESTTEMREAAKKGDENAIIRDSQFKEGVKDVAVEVKNEA